MTNPSITVTSDGTIIAAGEMATRLYASRVLRSAIKLWLEHGIIVSRGVSISQMLLSAERTTGEIFKGTMRKRADKAIASLDAWSETQRRLVEFRHG